MTNRPNLTEEEKEHYNKVAMDMVYKSKTPRTDKAEPKIQFIKGGWVRADFARELELELNELKKEIEEKDKNIKELISIAEDFYYDGNGSNILIMDEFDKLYERLLKIKKIIDLS